MPENKNALDVLQAVCPGKKCFICGGKSGLFSKIKDKIYYRCSRCLAVFLDKRFYLSKEAERKRYKEHNNDVNDPRYQKFVKPIVSRVQEEFTKEDKGLDFGAGTGPVVTKLLTDKGYKLELYDPFFCDRKNVLQKKYDFIVCCEVIEHFRFPFKEFRLLRSLLNPGGTLYCMTDIYSEEIDFKRWYYKDDPTHVVFYHTKTLEQIKLLFGFSGLEIKERLVQFFA
jgi:hypothetical protein